MPSAVVHSGAIHARAGEDFHKRMVQGDLETDPEVCELKQHVSHVM